MRIDYKPQFQKMLSQLPRDIIFLTKEMVDLFREDPYNLFLRNHPLDPPLERYHSISIDADLRILFYMVDPTYAIFIEIGTHDQIYNSK